MRPPCTPSPELMSLRVPLAMPVKDSVVPKYRADGHQKQAVMSHPNTAVKTGLKGDHKVTKLHKGKLSCSPRRLPRSWVVH